MNSTFNCPFVAAYSHSSSVSTYSVILCLGLQQGDPHDLALAAMFHDLGLNELPPKLQSARIEAMTADEQTI